MPQTSGKDEIKEFVTTFNYLLERLESGIMIQNNFLKNASHELKTPLTIIIGDIDVSLQQPRTNEQYEEILKSLQKDTLHLKAYSRRTFGFIRTGTFRTSTNGNCQNR